MKAYKVLSTNLDLEDGVFEHGYFLELRHAEDILKGCDAQFKGKEEVLDLEGTLTEYQTRKLEYTRSYKKPAVYYLSHWGSYKMTMWISEIHIQE